MKSLHPDLNKSAPAELVKTLNNARDMGSSEFKSLLEKYKFELQKYIPTYYATNKKFVDKVDEWLQEWNDDTENDEVEVRHINPSGLVFDFTLLANKFSSVQKRFSKTELSMKISKAEATTMTKDQFFEKLKSLLKEEVQNPGTEIKHWADRWNTDFPNKRIFIVRTDYAYGRYGATFSYVKDGRTMQSTVRFEKLDFEGQQQFLTQVQTIFDVGKRYSGF